MDDKINPFDIRTFSNFQVFKKRFLSQFPEDYLLKENENICWIWQGPRHRNNYGQTTWGSQNYLAHRMSYIIFKGLIPQGQIVRHTCDNRQCVNPNHLILGAYSDNSLDAIKRNRAPGQKLTCHNVIEIKTALKKPYYGLVKQLAKKYNVAESTISGIKANNSWGWLTI